MLLVIAARNSWILESFDITATYLHGEIDEDIWVKVPDGMLVPEEHRGKSLKLDKGLYGTKQGGQCWWKHFVQVMNEIGFNVSYYDVLSYQACHFQSILESKLSVTWDGNLHTIVGIKVKCPSPDTIILSQPFLTDKILEKHQYPNLHKH
ncbi:uncharacterized protein VP01_523g5 [Puccinia sorghi]|uniref:Reverse transcriptase Ty1/copia-type domain-containing protein n=1 Tax=Puccinia sorghi TaxID=27349 RepID=A0A0L6UMI3_9BASI|nr:uncharacterized protein VP01_523g5 [Puccinia sorghi]